MTTVNNLQIKRFTQSEVSAADVISRLSEIKYGEFTQQEQGELFEENVHFLKKTDGSKKEGFTSIIPKSIVILQQSLSAKLHHTDDERINDEQITNINSDQNYLIHNHGVRGADITNEVSRREDVVKSIFHSLGMYEKENHESKSQKFTIDLEEEDEYDAKKVLEEYEDLKSFLKIENNITMLNIMLTLLKKEISIIHDQLTKSNFEENINVTLDNNCIATGKIEETDFPASTARRHMETW